MTLSRIAILSTALFLASSARAQTVSIDTTDAGRHQTIDGFGTCLSGDDGQQPWFQQLYLDDLQASMLRMDITPQFISSYSDHHYNSPWYSNDPPLPGPDNNNVRTYTGPADYSGSYDGRTAEIAVMGPDIDANVQLFDYSGTLTPGTLAALGASKKAQLGDFKLFASMWSPAPWVKMTSGNTYQAGGTGMPTDGTPFPFIWGGNFAGGTLDTSGTPLAVFNDGTGPTSALTQFARGLAAYLRGFQQTYSVQLYAISIQNELNFEEFYNSATYPRASQYIAALLAARAELDKYPDLAPIQIMGPEDLMGGDAYSMWELGSGATTVDKNLQYLADVAADPDAGAALAYFCIHGYDTDGSSAAGATPTSWQWWLNGWSASPAAGIPGTVAGYASYGKKSWMTETSGEATDWLSPSTGFPNQGAWSIALKIHQALTAGNQSGWAYWQLDDGSPVGTQSLTDVDAGAGSPKYVAAKHFFHDIRPGAVRVDANVTGSSDLLASAYLHEGNGTLTVVLLNTGSSALTASLPAPTEPAGIHELEARTSQLGSYWQASTLTPISGSYSIPVPGYGVVTLVGTGTPLMMSGGEDAGSHLDAGHREVDAGFQFDDGGYAFECPDDGPCPGDAASGVPGTGKSKAGCGCSGSSLPIEALAFAAIALGGAARRRRRLS